MLIYAAYFASVVALVASFFQRRYYKKAIRLSDARASKHLSEWAATKIECEEAQAFARERGRELGRRAAEAEALRAELVARQTQLETVHSTMPGELRKAVGLATFGLRECHKIASLPTLKPDDEKPPAGATSDIAKILRVKLTAESTLAQIKEHEDKHGLNLVIGESNAPGV